MRNRSLGRVSVLIAAMLMVMSFDPRSGAAAGAVETLYSFCAHRADPLLGRTSKKNCTDGEGPAGGLIMDAEGTLYGTTHYGGAHDAGTVFALTPSADKTQWTQTVLHSFCAQENCADGKDPASLIIDTGGKLYGTTFKGGAHDHGTVFVLTPPAKTTWTEAALHVFGLTPDADKIKWTEMVLYSFCAQSNVIAVPGFAVEQCADGDDSGGLIIDAAGKLYGGTESGGAHDHGTVFELTQNADKTKWTETVLYSFCAQEHCTDGEEPEARLIMDKAGKLYGVTETGGAPVHVVPYLTYGYLPHSMYSPGGTIFYGGTVFALTPSADKTQWTQTVLYSFCAQENCADGAYPDTDLITDAAGKLYGTSHAGAYSHETVFGLTPNADKTKWTETVLYSFCAQENCADGKDPTSLIIDAAGKLYGVAETGGVHDHGTLFALTSSADKTKWTKTVLYSFCPQGGICTDGDFPVGLMMDGAGKTSTARHSTAALMAGALCSICHDRLSVRSTGRPLSLSAEKVGKPNEAGGIEA